MRTLRISAGLLLAVVLTASAHGQSPYNLGEEKKGWSWSNLWPGWGAKKEPETRSPVPPGAASFDRGGPTGSHADLPSPLHRMTPRSLGGGLSLPKPQAPDLNLPSPVHRALEGTRNLVRRTASAIRRPFQKKPEPPSGQYRRWRPGRRRAEKGSWFSLPFLKGPEEPRPSPTLEGFFSQPRP